MPKEKPPAFQWYPKDYLSDANVKRMTWTERGIYVHAMNICWLENGIPSDPEEVAKSLEIRDLDWFLPHWKNIVRCFKNKPKDKKKLAHPRLEKEKRIQRDNRKKWKENGKKGGRPSLSKDLGETKAKALGFPEGTKKEPLQPPNSNLQPSTPVNGNSNKADGQKPSGGTITLMPNAKLARAILDQKASFISPEMEDTGPEVKALFDAIWDNGDRSYPREMFLAYILEASGKDKPSAFLARVLCGAKYGPKDMLMETAKKIITEWEA